LDNKQEKRFQIGVINNQLIDMSYLSRSFIFSILVLLIASCASTKTVNSLQQSKDDGKIQVAILQMNDVYEISGVDGGKVGGLARVAHFYKELKQKYPQSMMVLAGDFLNPSLIGTMRYEGDRIRGRQMVEVLNSINLDVVAFGNHEFDVPEVDLQKRINESNFDWLATNLAQICGNKEYPFYKEFEGKKHFLPESKVYKFTDSDGTTLNLGMFSATINSNPVDYVHYLNPDSCASVEIMELKPQSDVLIGLTHLTITEDLDLAKKHPEVALIMGGHEHDHNYQKVGKTIVAKADANAKSVYVHILSFDHSNKTTTLESDLVYMDEKIGLDVEATKVIQKWNSILDSEIKKVFPEPYEIVFHAAQALDGKEITTRHKPSNMGILFAQSVKNASKNNAQIGLINSGSIRIDDELQGDILALDIFRALPFGGAIYDVKMKGSLLLGIMRYSEKSKGLGAYLQYTGLEKKEDNWMIDGQPIDPEKHYMIAMTDFLLRGLDIPFLNEQNEGILAIYKPNAEDVADNRLDVRRAIIEYLKTL